MSFWILDTDHASLFLAGNKPIIASVAKHSNDVAITVITVQELFNGWVGRLNDPAQTSKLIDLNIYLHSRLINSNAFIR